VADLAVFVVSAVDGVEVQTERLWRRAPSSACRAWCSSARRTRSAPTSTACSTSCVPRSGHGFIPLELPLGEAAALHGMADVLSEQAYEYEPGGTHHSEALPADVADEEHAPRRGLEEIVPATTNNSSATCLARSRPWPSWNARWRTRCSTARSSRCCSARRHRGGHRPPGRLHLRARSVTGRPSRRGAGAEGDAKSLAVNVGRRLGQAPGLRVQDHRRPVRRPTLDVQGAVRHPGNRPAPAQQPARTPRNACTPCSACAARSRRRSTTWSPATSPRWPSWQHPHRRHACPEGHAGARRAGTARCRSTASR
jgi:hypothetical protein